MTKPIVFISYSHIDEDCKDRLVKHLEVLQREGILDIRYDRHIAAGEKLYREIQEAMDVASIAILLISKDFLTSEFIRSKEVPRLLERQEKEGLHIFPIIIKPCPWRQVKWLNEMNLRPKDSIPISHGTIYQIDAEMVKIVEEVATIIPQESKQSTEEYQKVGAKGISIAHPQANIVKTTLPRVYDERKLPPIGSSELPFYIWNVQNFDGFFYDIDDNLGKESLKLLQPSLGAKKRTIGIDKLSYTTEAQQKELKVVTEAYSSNYSAAADAGLEQTASGKGFASGKYWLLGWQGEPYIALNGKVDKLAKLIIEQGTAASEKKTLQVGETWYVGGGWAITANSIDARTTPRQVWLTLSKDGIKKDDKVISSGSGGKPIFTYVERSIAGETDVPLFVTYVDSVFTGATSDMVQLRYTWAVSTSVTQIKSSDTYGIFKDAIINQTARSLSLKNSDIEIALSPNTIVNLMGKLKFIVADKLDVLRFYPVIYQVPY